MRVPLLWASFTEAFFVPCHKTAYYNYRVYDGFTSNEFIYGNMMCILHKLEVIKKPHSRETCADHRGYFIGYMDDEE